MVPNSGTILASAAAHQDDAVLLHVMSLAGDIRRHDAACTEPDTRRLALRRVGLLGLGDPDFETDALQRGRHHLPQRRRDRFASLLRLAAALGRPISELVQRIAAWMAGGKQRINGTMD